ncbi:MAG: deoxyribodipyrimidine photolyase, partial [Prochlorococcaceae cyanobacterium MAG_34]|nr:deoxyribodipyrimidine photolyase [Prochlorococcaceae cyanobacterium MAG_34]
MDGRSQARLGIEIARSYPLPLIDWQTAAAVARDRVWSLRQQHGFAATADAIQQRHGSRRSGLRTSSRGRRGNSPIDQLCLDFVGDMPVAE